MAKNRELVVKTNRLIESSYRLSLNEQRIILFAICRAREDQKGLFSNQPVTITAAEFLSRFPDIGTKHVYSVLKDAMESLYERSVTFYDTHPETGEQRVNKTRWISKASYVNGAGLVQVIFAPDIVDNVARIDGKLSSFTSYELETISRLPNSYSVQIYELMRQNLKIGKRAISLSDFKAALDLAPDEYKLTADFILRIVKPSVKHINEHTDLKVTYKTHKTGRAITDFDFTIKAKADVKTPALAVDKIKSAEPMQIGLLDDPAEEF